MPNPLILIVEDEQPIRAMLRIALEKQFQVQEAADAMQAEKWILSHQLPDLILLDWMLPKMSGVAFTKRLKQNRLTQNIPIIMLTAKAEESDKVTGLETGVDDFVVKPFSPRELIARVQAVLRRGPLKQPDNVMIIRELMIDLNSQRVSIADQNLKLGPLEYKLLCFFVTHPDRVYSRDELLSHVWGNDTFIDERTVDVHIRRLRKRLKLGDHDRLIQTIHGSGYRFSEKNL